ncbi:MAG: HAD-IA family hydrolase, partial [Ignavibacteriaceae bacterium]
RSKKLPKMFEFISGLKNKYNLKLTAVSNEGRELTEYRIKEFELNKLFDSFIASSYVHFRKPDIDIYEIALDVSQVNAENVVYLDDRHMFIEVAETLGIKGIHHKSYEATKKELAKFGFEL